MADVTVNGNVSVDGQPSSTTVASGSINGFITSPLAIGEVDATTLSASGFMLGSAAQGLTASTTQTQGQGALTHQINQISVCAHDNDTVTLPTAVAGMMVAVINEGAHTLQIFPASGDQIGSGAANASTTLATLHNAYWVCHGTGHWNTLALPSVS